MSRATFIYVVLSGLLSVWLSFHFLSTSIKGVLLPHPPCAGYGLGEPALFLCLSHEASGYTEGSGYTEARRSTAEQQLVAWLLPTPFQAEERFPSVGTDELYELFLDKGWIFWPAFLFNVMWYMALCFTPWLIGWALLRRKILPALTARNRAERPRSGTPSLGRSRSWLILLIGDLIALSFLRLVEQAQYQGGGSLHDLFYPGQVWRNLFMMLVGHFSEAFFFAWLLAALWYGAYRPVESSTTTDILGPAARAFRIAGPASILYGVVKLMVVGRWSWDFYLLLLPYSIGILVFFFAVMLGWRALYVALTDPLEEPPSSASYTASSETDFTWS